MPNKEMILKGGSIFGQITGQLAKEFANFIDDLSDPA